MGRTILAIVAGCVVSVLIVFAVEALGSVMFPPPEGLNMRDPAAVQRFISQMPAAAFALVVFGWMLGAAVGAWVGSRLSRTGKAWPGLVVGAVTFVATAVNLFTIAHPTWVVGAAVVGIPLATWIGARGGRTPAAGMTPARME